MGDWRETVLGEMLTQRKEQIIIQPESQYSLVTISNKGEVRLREKKKGDLIDAKKGYVTKAGDFIYSRLAVHTGAFGLVPLELNNALITGEMPSFEIDEKQIHPKVLIELIGLPDFQWKLKQLAKGIGRVRVKESMMLALTVTVPRLSIQQRQNKKIEQVKNNKFKLTSEISCQKSLLKKLRQQILQEAIEGKLTANWRKQNPDVEPAGALLERIQAEKAQLIKDKKIKKQKPLPPIDEEEKLFELPEGWAWCRLQDITNLITDGKHGDCNNQKSSGYYFLSAKDIQNGKLLYRDARQIVPHEFQEVHNRTNLEAGDICMVNTGATVGKLALAPDNPLTAKTTFQKALP